MLAVQTRYVDGHRAVRAMLGFIRNDRLQIEAVMAEAAEDEKGANGLVLALLDLASTIAVEGIPGAEDALQTMAIELTEKVDDDE